MPEHVATLVLSGGEAKGAFEVGAEHVLREEKGYTWDRIFGVSVGALNVTLLASERSSNLTERRPLGTLICNGISLLGGELVICLCSHNA
jgi:predicted acylesterase/phospholipase RssA